MLLGLLFTRCMAVDTWPVPCLLVCVCVCAVRYLYYIRLWMWIYDFAQWNFCFYGFFVAVAIVVPSLWIGRCFACNACLVTINQLSFPLMPNYFVYTTVTRRWIHECGHRVPVGFFRFADVGSRDYQNGKALGWEKCDEAPMSPIINLMWRLHSGGHV